MAHIPVDRHHALVANQDRRSRSEVAVLSAGIIGFTPLTDALILRFGGLDYDGDDESGHGQAATAYQAMQPTADND
jgi:hypothetical protein